MLLSWTAECHNCSSGFAVASDCVGAIKSLMACGHWACESPSLKAIHTVFLACCVQSYVLFMRDFSKAAHGVCSHSEEERFLMLQLPGNNS